MQRRCLILPEYWKLVSRRLTFLNTEAYLGVISRNDAARGARPKEVDGGQCVVLTGCSLRSVGQSESSMPIDDDKRSQYT